MQTRGMSHPNEARASMGADLCMSTAESYKSLGRCRVGGNVCHVCGTFCTKGIYGLWPFAHMYRQHPVQNILCLGWCYRCNHNMARLPEENTYITMSPLRKVRSTSMCLCEMKNSIQGIKGMKCFGNPNSPLLPSAHYGQEGRRRETTQPFQQV